METKILSIVTSPQLPLVYLKGRIGSCFAGWLTCWSNLMAILYQYMNPIKAVAHTMKRPKHEPNCNRMIQGGLVSWNCIRGFLQLNPRPHCILRFSNLQLLCLLKNKVKMFYSRLMLFDSKSSLKLCFFMRPERHSFLQNMTAFPCGLFVDTQTNTCWLVQTVMSFIKQITLSGTVWDLGFRLTCCFVADACFIIQTCVDSAVRCHAAEALRFSSIMLARWCRKAARFLHCVLIFFPCSLLLVGHESCYTMHL